MVGDSIVFGWSRVGQPVWDEFYGDRKAVNIGSSGDRTYHMLWHFQNGGLDGMKDRNPKVVVDDDRHQQPRRSRSCMATTPPTASSRCSRRSTPSCPSRRSC